MLEITGKQAIEIYSILDKNMPIASLSSLSREERKVVDAILKYIKVSNITEITRKEEMGSSYSAKKEVESPLIIKNILAKLRGKSSEILAHSSQTTNVSTGHRLSANHLKNNIDSSLDFIGRRQKQLQQKKVELENLQIQLKEDKSELNKKVKSLEELLNLKKILTVEIKKLQQNPTSSNKNSLADHDQLKEQSYLKRSQLRILKSDISVSKQSIKKYNRKIGDSTKRSIHLKKVINKEKEKAIQQYQGRFELSDIDDINK